MRISRVSCATGIGVRIEHGQCKAVVGGRSKFFSWLRNGFEPLIRKLCELLGPGLRRDCADDNERGDRGKERGKDGVALGKDWREEIPHAGCIPYESDDSSRGDGSY